MNAPRPIRIGWAVLLVVALAAAGCGKHDGDNHSTPDTAIQADADIGGDADTGTDGGMQGEGLRLTGGIVPAGGTQMSSSFTLNGGIRQPAKSTTVESASFTLELTKSSSRGGTP